MCILLFAAFGFVSIPNAKAEDLQLDMRDINGYISDVGICDVDFDIIIDYIKSADMKGVWVYISHIVADEIKSVIVYHKNIMYTLIAICFVSVVLKGSAWEKYRDAYGQILACAAAFVLLNLYVEFYTMAENVINNLAGFMNVSLPVYFGISASVTGRLPFSVYGLFAGFVALFQWGTVYFVLPAITIVALFGTSENICAYFDTSGIRKYIVSTVNWLLGLYTTFFVAILKISQIGAYGTDKLVMSGIRYTLSHSIPVVGGFLSEIAGAVITSTLILHNAVGIGCVLVIGLIAIVPFAIIFAVSFVLKLIASLMSSVAYKEVCNMIMCFGECLCELSVIMLCGCVTFVIGIGIQFSLGR